MYNEKNFLINNNFSKYKYNNLIYKIIFKQKEKKKFFNNNNNNRNKINGL